MRREGVITYDGSHTVAAPELNVTYHSKYGAVHESVHVFIQAGLYHAWDIFGDEPLCIFEMGFGTGLNAFLSAIEAQKQQRKIYYTAIERHPLTMSEVQQLQNPEHC